MDPATIAGSGSIRPISSTRRPKPGPVKVRRSTMPRRLGVVLHSVRLHAGDRAGVCGEPQVRDHRQHGIGEILHHQGHAVPAESAPRLDIPPVVRALVEKQWRAVGDRVHVDRMGVEIGGKRLLHVEETGGEFRPRPRDCVECGEHVCRIVDGAIEVGAEATHTAGDPEVTHPEQAVHVPLEIGAAELDLERRQAVLLDPLLQGDRMAVARLGAGEIARRERIEAANQVPGGELRGRRGCEELGGKPPAKLCPPLPPRRSSPGLG